ncbi:hypothetical protein VCHA54P489_20171 [Vibrio chagasii]|nr:hypothetical protein VCHA36O157_10379 [Vibrio chagasii]CAH6843664.1 hypothetical protein VCHA34P115_10217 [Vibrio chagasii]CAH6860437.1 hypothetical protein VCHA34O109_10397 [Vibrio chagasii]CAH7064110.1 hypothetical protein VCHA37P191_10150 [Vibrio chagasii]CAH7086773.1 hypothetical protein VCHA43O270_10688 [Vibrio chagasii]
MKSIFLVFTDGYDLCLFFDVLIFFIYKTMTLLLTDTFLCEIRSSRELICASINRA